MAYDIANDDLYQNDDLDMMTRRVLGKKEIQDFTYSPGGTPIYKWLRQSPASIMKTDGSGYELEFYTDYGEADGGFYEGHEALNVSGLSGLNRGKLGWKRAYSGSALYEVDIMANSGEAQVFDAVKRAVRKAREKLEHIISGSLVTAQAGLSLDSLFDALFTVNYAGIARTATTAANDRYHITVPTASDNFFWHPNYEEYDISNAEDEATAGNGFWLFILAMQRLIRHISETNDGNEPQIILCNEMTYEWIGTHAQTKIQYFWPTKDPKYIDLGFQGLSFMGKPLVIAPEMAASSFDHYLWFLNNKYIGLQDNPKDNFKFTGWKDASDNTRSRQCKFFWTGNVFCTNPGGLGVLHGVA